MQHIAHQAGRVVLAAVLTLTFAFTAQTAVAADKLKIGYIYPSPAGDVGWAHELDKGRQAIEAEFGDRVESVTVENVPEGPDAARIMNQMVSNGAGMMMLGSFGYMNDGLKLAKRHPQVSFIHASGYSLADNFGNFQTRNYEAAYLAGMAAGYASKSKVLGAVAAYPIPEVIGILNTFTLGAQSVNAEATLKVVWLNSWFDPSKAQASARSLIAQSADVVFSIYQDTPSVVSACEEEGVYVINTSSDMKKYAPKHLLASIQISWAPHFIDSVRKTLNGEFTGTAYWGGMQDGAVSLSSLSDDLSAEQRSAIAAKAEELKAGSFHPLTGPIVDQSGAVKIADGETISDTDLLGISWLVQGVETKLPN